MYKTILQSIVLFLVSLHLYSQDNFIHIPKTSSYIITIRPLKSEDRTNSESISRLEMFGTVSSYDSELSVFGNTSLSPDPRERLTNYLTGTITSPLLSGIDSTRNMYAFHEENDTCSYWAYIFPIANEVTFAAYVRSNLFPQDAILKNDHGYNSITKDRITAGWTTNYAVVLLADYYHSTVATDWTEEYYTQAAIADSIAMAEVVTAEYESQQVVLTDSVKSEKTSELEDENERLLKELEKGDFPEDTSLAISPNGGYYDPYYSGETEIQNDSLHDKQAFHILNRLMNLEQENSISSNKNFRSLQEEKYDASYWYNYGLVMQEEYRRRQNNWYSYSLLYGTGSERQLDTVLFPTMWENSYVAGIVNFNDTITTMVHRISVGDQLSDMTTGMYRGKVDRKMLNYVCADNLMSLVCVSMDMEKFIRFSGHAYKENLMYSSMGMFEQTYLAMWEIMRVFIDDKTMYNMFTGQFVFAVTDLKPVVSTYVSYEYDDNFNGQEVTKERTKIIPEFVFMAGIGQRKDLQKILEILERTQLIKKVNKDYYMVTSSTNPASQLYIVFRKGMLMFTNNEDLVNNHLEKGYKGKHRLGKQMRKLARKSALMAWWDGPKTFDTMRRIKKDDPNYSAEKTELENSVSSGLILGKKGRKGEHRIQVTMTSPPENDGQKHGSINRFFHTLNGLFLIAR